MVQSCGHVKDSEVTFHIDRHPERSPGFLVLRVKLPLTILQVELFPPHTPHLSSSSSEAITLSQPTFCTNISVTIHKKICLKVCVIDHMSKCPHKKNRESNLLLYRLGQGVSLPFSSAEPFQPKLFANIEELRTQESLI